MKLNFSENLKKLRKQKEITQEALADVLGVSGQSVSRWEIGICYPDLELLPSIANYFGVSVDSLLSNDTKSKQEEHEAFYPTLDSISDGAKRIEFIREYCCKYPENDEYAYVLVQDIKDYAAADETKLRKYMPLVEKLVPRLLETRYRNATIQIMVSICEEKDLQSWLSMTPYSGWSRRYCLVARAMAHGDWEHVHVQQGLEMFESMADQLDRRYPDQLGPQGKVQFHREVLDMIRSLGSGVVPDGWKMFYAYKQLVMSACLFGCGEGEQGWKNFREAIAMYQEAHALPETYLSIGGKLFSDLKVSKDWNYAIDSKGERHKLFAMVNLSRYNAVYICDLLENPRWAWFDSVRDMPEYCEALSWVKQKVQEQRNED